MEDAAAPGDRPAPLSPPSSVSSLLLAHLSDAHARDAGDLRAFERQLDLIAARRPDHLVISGDLLDRWNPPLLQRLLDALAVRDLLHPDRTTLIHGNHDLASGGGYPRRRRDLARLVLRAWDLPPLLQARRRRFYAALEGRAAGLSAFDKDLPALRLVVVDSVSVPWLPLRLHGARLQGQHATGVIRDADLQRLARTSPSRRPIVLVLHHYPLAVEPFRWRNGRFEVAMEIRGADRAKLWDAARSAGVRLMLCGHVHRARLEWHDGIAIGLQGQSGAAWAGRPIGWYRVDGDSVRMEVERTA